MPTSRLSAIARWRRRLAVRSLVREVRDTLQGKAMIALMVLAVPSLVQLASDGGPLGAADLDDAQAMGVLVVAHAAVALCFAVMVPMLLLRDFVLHRKEEPLTAHPSALPDLALYRSVTAIAGSAAFLWLFFYIFVSRPLWQVVDGSVPAIILHVVIGHLWLFVVGAALAAASRAVVLGTRLVARARLVHRLGIVPFLASFPLVVLLPDWLTTRAPGSLARVGEVAPTLGYFLETPLAAAAHLARGGFLAAAAWTAGTALLALMAFRALGRWSLRAPAELPLDLHVDDTRRYASAFGLTTGGSRGFVRHARIFWIKDVVAPAFRRPSGYLNAQVVVLTAGLGALAVLRYTPPPVDGLIPEAALLRGVVLAMAGALAMLHSLDALGREGARIAFLRPVVTPRRLFGVKATSATLFVVVHALIHAAVLWSVARALGLAAGSLAGVLALASVGGCGFALAGTALGFLLPDFRARGWFLAGASTPAKYLYGLVVGVGVALYLTNAALVAAGVFGPSATAGFLSVTLVPLLAATAVAGVWGVKRLEGLDHGPEMLR